MVVSLINLPSHLLLIGAHLRIGQCISSNALRLLDGEGSVVLVRVVGQCSNVNRWMSLVAAFFVSLESARNPDVGGDKVVQVAVAT